MGGNRGSVFRNNYKGLMDKTQRDGIGTQVGMAGVVGVVER